MRTCHLVTAIIALALMNPVTSGDVDFTRDIRSILSQHCFPCHGPDEQARQAKLSLFTFDEATSDRGGMRAIVPGDPDSSEAWRRMTDHEDPMPPVEENNPLDARELELLEQWIREGASYSPHWAYVPPQRPIIPEVSDDQWPLDPIDHHVLARLEAEGLQPVPEADRITLIRRLTHDLTGLPPTAKEIDDFLQDTRPGAYERVVDRLLASDRFGERMAMYWLDLVRYADTVGYHGDQTHRIWPYRDYVINAFNRNLPFDQFTIEQLAGDLLPAPNQDQLVATGYNRLIQTSHEGGVQLKEYRAIYMADRVRNVSETWMGATVGCAQCHDHKYDPFTARDFYTLGAFFADVDDEEHLRNQYGGLNTLPTRRLPEMGVSSAASRARVAAIEARREQAQAELERVMAGLEDHQPEWEETIQVQADEIQETTWVDDVLATGGDAQGDWTFVREPALPAHSGETYRKQSSTGLIQHYTVGTTNRTIPIHGGERFFAWVYLSPDDPPGAVMLQFNAGGTDWLHRATWGGDQIEYGRRDEDWAGYRRQGDLPPTGQWVRLEISADEVGLAPGQIVSGMAFTQFGGTVYWDRAGVEGHAVPREVLDVLSLPREDRTPEQVDLVRHYQAETSPDVRDRRAAISTLEQDRQSVEAALPRTMYTKRLETPREVRVLPRGNWLDESGEIVEPAVPVFLGDLATDGPATRLDLARWLVRPGEEDGVGEMTARVLVNRLWALFLGEGLCPSLDDFGGQGQPPNHPELLDLLAIDFVESDWNIKDFIRRLVLTRTYRLSSIPPSVLVEQDPTNALFARQARGRLPAESVRDTILAVSGLLVEKIGGPSVKPPQPEGYYQHLNFPVRRYDADGGAEQWRRGVYVHWQRQYLHPMLRAFDAPAREDCTARRSVSNTPQAALALLNDPVVVQASRAFADRILASEQADDRSRLSWAVREAVGRWPTEEEIDVLVDLLAENRAYYLANPTEADAAAGVSEGTLDSGARAAWTGVARVILNLHETITRE
ncbi:MAG: DUF1549 domain-containing protein [Phycisphaerales bacterium]|nr:DUF1549 domain-containing protein [Phycisphaerales bacterium]